MERINIMTSCDDNLAKYTLPQIASIGSNLKNYYIDYYMFHSRISADNIKLIRQYSETFENIQFHEIIIEDVEPYIELAKYGGGWAYEAYFSFCCHEYLPESVDRIWYIDAGDVIIVGDVAEYYFGDFDGCSLFATLNRANTRSGDVIPFTKDDMADIEHLKLIALGAINSGSYVINVAQFRADHLSINDFLYVANVLHERFPDEQVAYRGDQGLLSVAFVGDIKYFDYPRIRDQWYMPYNFGLWYLHSPIELWYTPKVLHYYGTTFKPWQARLSLDELKKYDFKAGYENLFAPFIMNHRQIEFFEVWWKYCEMTPIYEETNNTASTYARALENHFLPLCKKYNELVNGYLVLQQKFKSLQQESHDKQHEPNNKQHKPHGKKKKKK